MATQNRRTILASLKTALEELSPTYVKTVVRTYTEIDITNYLTTDLSLIEIQEPSEVAETEMTGRRSIRALEVTLRVWFVDWAEDPDATIYEALMKQIRDKVGAKFTLPQAGVPSAIATWIGGTSKIEGEMPVWNFSMGLVLKYYLDQQAT
ncbi:hypothetical protein E3J84_05500 [Candidatus Aerophobetes bacterium]|uniref:Uncharacterized protein n=1 Tax=Aerophobetes bacterium TaxID=2030807 RepID=A0A523RTI9_UNCAE|nr:MAG: hypothetical protein E3J84_05500 [Candidatus Aerophobetes bacterium]